MPVVAHVKFYAVRTLSACPMLWYTPKTARKFIRGYACGEVAERLKAAVC
jgi:hypothetical protein